MQLWGHHLFHIPPKCKLNPVYEELVGLRFRSPSFFPNLYGEDVTP
ncbi:MULTISPECIES: Mo-dependent nitrogenase C-terminal domain-containing protein [unclassified Microcoleus]